jgi:Rv2993c-like, N-terminal
MKLIRFALALAGRVQHGSLHGDLIQPLEGELHALTAVPGAKAIPLGSVRSHEALQAASATHARFRAAL